ncbi:MAG: hypothetical protein HQK96_01615 [Nitrospirae bacterium]|nr:hypothetical protein [Nitrospirota bacterium]
MKEHYEYTAKIWDTIRCFREESLSVEKFSRGTIVSKIYKNKSGVEWCIVEFPDCTVVDLPVKILKVVSDEKV